MSSLRLDWCSYEAAKYAVGHWYCRPDMPRGKLVKIGVWEDGQFEGVVLFGCGTGGVSLTGRKFGIGPFEICELCRLALRRHDAPLSRIIKIALLMLRKSQPGLKLVVTYANPTEGHHGGIYQAGGWIYVGQSAPDAMWRDAFGVEHHSRNTSGSGLKKFFDKTVQVIKRGDCVKVPLAPKHKYLFPLDDETRAKIEPMRKPNPKRVRSEPADTPAVHAGEGGSTPTRTLQPMP